MAWNQMNYTEGQEIKECQLYLVSNLQKIEN